MRGIVVALVCVGCYSPAYRDCELTCAGMACPSGLSCLDGYCRTNPGGASCDLILSDARGGDAAITCAPGLTACGDECFDLRTTAAHCGRCDRDCMTSTCSNSRCATTTVASNIPAPSKLVGGHGVVAYGSGRYDSCPAGSKLVVLRTNGTTGFEVVGACTTALAVAQGRVYVGELSRVRAYAISDGALSGTLPFPTGDYVGGVAASTTDAFVGVHSPGYSVNKAPAQLGSSTPIYTQSPRKVNAIVRTATSVWFENRVDAETFRRVNRIAPDGSAYLEVTTTTEAANLAFGAGRVFVSEEAGMGRLRSYAEDGSQPATLVAQSPGVLAVAADDAGVYWSQKTSTGFEITARHHDTETLEVLATETDVVIGVAVDGPWLYWLTRSTFDVGVLRRTLK